MNSRPICNCWSFKQERKSISSNKRMDMWYTTLFKSKTKNMVMRPQDQEPKQPNHGESLSVLALETRKEWVRNHYY